MDAEHQQEQQQEQQMEEQEDSVFISYEEFHDMCKRFKKAYDAADKIRVQVWCIYEMIKNPMGSYFKYRLERVGAYDSKEEALKKSEIFTGQILIRMEKKAANCIYYNDKNMIQSTITDSLTALEENEMVVRFYTKENELIWLPLKYVKANNQISPTSVFYMCNQIPGINISDINNHPDIEYHFE